MSINKSTLGTIVGAALLGLAKSKIGGTNEDEPRIVVLENCGYTQNARETHILLKDVPEDIRGITQVYDNERPTFRIPTTAVIEFQLESTSIEFPDYPFDQIQEYEDDCKRWHFDENEQLDDDDEDKQDWEEWGDVPDYWVEDLVEERRESVQEDYNQQCYDAVSEFVYPIAEKIMNDIKYSEEILPKMQTFHWKEKRVSYH